MLQVQNLTVRYENLTVVNDISFSLAENQWLMVVGPNGAGKSTLVNAISQGLAYSGRILYDGEEVGKMKPAQLAKKLGVLSQTRTVAYSFTVGEIVRLGRYAYAPGLFSTFGEEDEASVHNALVQTGMLPLKDQSVLTLSGGELQRTFLAQIFAQNPRLLILDEPTNHLDLVYQKQIFGLIGEWLRQPGRAVISVVHDLALARSYGTQVMLLHEGRIVSMGDARQVLSRDNLQAVYHMDVHAWMRQMLHQWEEDAPGL